MAEWIATIALGIFAVWVILDICRRYRSSFEWVASWILQPQVPLPTAHVSSSSSLATDEDAAARPGPLGVTTQERLVQGFIGVFVVFGIVVIALVLQYLQPAGHARPLDGGYVTFGDTYPVEEERFPEEDLYVLGKELHDTTLNLHYTEQPFFTDEANHVLPVVDCTRYDSTDALHHRLFPSHALTAGNARHKGKSGKTRKQTMTETEPLSHLRAYALSRCALWPKSVVSLLDTLPSQKFEAHLARPPFWKVSSPSIHVDAPVTHVLVARNGSRYYRVLMVHKSPETQKYQLMPVLLNEADMLDAAEQWYQRFMSKEKLGTQYYRCFCAAFWDIVGSGLFLWGSHTPVDAGNNNVSGTELDIDVVPAEPPWRLFIGAEVTYNVSGTAGQTSEFFWPRRHYDFPGVLDDTHYGIGQLKVHGKVDIRYTEVEGALTYEHLEKSDPIVAKSLEGTAFLDDPEDPAFHSPYLVAVPLASLPKSTRRISDTAENDCFQHCMAIEQIHRDKLAVREAPK